MLQLSIYFILPSLLQERKGKPCYDSQAASWKHLSPGLEKEVFLLYSCFKRNIFLWDVGTLQVPHSLPSAQVSVPEFLAWTKPPILFPSKGRSIQD